MCVKPRWLREQLRQRRNDAGFRSTLMRFAEPVDADFADAVSEDLAAKAPVGYQWLVNRETDHALRLTLVPAR